MLAPCCCARVMPADTAAAAAATAVRPSMGALLSPARPAPRPACPNSKDGCGREWADERARTVVVVCLAPLLVGELGARVGDDSPDITLRPPSLPAASRLCLRCCRMGEAICCSVFASSGRMGRRGLDPFPVACWLRDLGPGSSVLVLWRSAAAAERGPDAARGRCCGEGGLVWSLGGELGADLTSGCSRGDTFGLMPCGWATPAALLVVSTALGARKKVL